MLSFLPEESTIRVWNVDTNGGISSNNSAQTDARTARGWLQTLGPNTQVLIQRSHLMKNFLAYFLASALLTLGLNSCFMKTPLPTVEGPEASDLMRSVNGYLIWPEGRSLKVLSLPNGSLNYLLVNSYSWGGDRFSAEQRRRTTLHE